MTLLFVGLYALAMSVVVAVLLVGEWPIFRKTPISWCHWLLTQGLIQGALYTRAAASLALRLPCRGLVGGICGRGAVEALHTVEHFFCGQRNPVVQVIYCLVVTLCYYVYHRFLFIHLPSKGLAIYHVYTGTIAGLLCLLLFMICSVSDPGTVTLENARGYVALFPYDNVLFSPKRCGTCHIEKPARSKHCSVCNRCDHHCIWINNCVGYNNHRYFLLFLLCNFVATLYGSVAIPLFLYGEIGPILHRPVLRHPKGPAIILAQNPLQLLEFLSVRYIALFTLFWCTVGFCLLVTGFLLYHAYLITLGRTQNENFKRGPDVTGPNLYDKGWLENWREVLFPVHVRHVKQN